MSYSLGLSVELKLRLLVYRDCDCVSNKKFEMKMQALIRNKGNIFRSCSLRDSVLELWLLGKLLSIIVLNLPSAAALCFAESNDFDFFL